MISENPVRILFRTWSSESAGVNSRQDCRSGDQNRRFVGGSDTARNFKIHVNTNNRKPTFLISTTGDPIRALSIAINKMHRGEKNVQIAIIRTANYLPGEELAGAARLNPCLYKTEFLFLWEIKTAEIMTVVSLATLIRRGLYQRCRTLNPDTWIGGNEENALPPLPDLRSNIFESNEKAWKGGETWPERSGRYVLAIVECFGDNVPLRALASLLWEHRTHFEPENYWTHRLNWRVRDAIERGVEDHGTQCAHDAWCGDLADDEDEKY